MAFTPEVEQAIAELRDAHPDSEVAVEDDGNGGAFVTVDPVELGEQYTPSTSWIKFQITFQYPASDVYPLFIDPGVRRVGGPPANGTPLGEGTALTQYAEHGNPGSAIPVLQLSRRSNRLNPATDTAALKVEKVLTWLRGMQ